MPATGTLSINRTAVPNRNRRGRGHGPLLRAIGRCYPRVVAKARGGRGNLLIHQTLGRDVAVRAPHRGVIVKFWSGNELP